MTLKEGGRTFISVVDDGKGMTADELVLAVERHCTSKLPDDDLTHVRTLGFRGEALPAIASVSRFTLVTSDGETGTELAVAAQANVEKALTHYFADRAETFVGIFAENAIARMEKIRVRTLTAAPHAAAQLMQLRQPETLRLLHQHHCRVRHIHAHFNDRGGDQHSNFTLAESSENVVAFCRRQASMDFFHPPS